MNQTRKTRRISNPRPLPAPMTLREQMARAEQDAAGYPGYVGHRIVGTPRIGADGQPRRHGHNPAFPGPLDGQPMMTWAAEFLYDNGITVVIDSGGERSRPWPGGSTTI